MDLVLFDIDGTLLRTRAAGRESLDEAFLAVAGWEDATHGVHIAGSTDAAIVRDVCERFGETTPPFDVEALRHAYYAGLARRLAEVGRAERCPGVEPVLDWLAGRAHVALLTGNWATGASLKLGAVGLGGRFAFGAFGDDAVDRDALVPVARRRAAERGLPVERVVVVGDTPADVACARAGGAVAVAVETGFASPEELANAGPDLQLSDLARAGGWFRALFAG
ncbi:MAG: HAD family hydrolase [Myxococcota bacterium]